MFFCKKINLIKNIYKKINYILKLYFLYITIIYKFINTYVLCYNGIKYIPIFINILKIGYNLKIFL